MTAGLSAAQYVWPQIIFYVLPVSCYLGIACGVIAHNHNHRPTFISRWANHAFGHVLTCFYGYPTLMWIPTHNENHHKFLNRQGDATITWRYTNRHNLFVALSYFFVSAYFQSEPIQRYIRRAKMSNRQLYARIMVQYGIWIGFLTLSLATAQAMHPGRLGFRVWIFATLVPAFASLFLIMFFNYIQHVHADAWSEFDHSRNFTGPIFNYLFFNNGYHTIHHEHPSMHWTALPAAHAGLAASISPRLIETNLVWYLLRQYILSPLLPRLGSRQLGAEPEAATRGEVPQISLHRVTVTLPADAASEPGPEFEEADIEHEQLVAADGKAVAAANIAS